MFVFAGAADRHWRYHRRGSEGLGCWGWVRTFLGEQRGIVSLQKDYCLLCSFQESMEQNFQSRFLYQLVNLFFPLEWTCTKRGIWTALKGAYSKSATKEFPVLNLPHVVLLHAGVCVCVCVCARVRVYSCSWAFLPSATGEGFTATTVTIYNLIKC